MRPNRLSLLLLLLPVPLTCAMLAEASCVHSWSDDDQSLLRELRLAHEVAPSDASSLPSADDEAARLGQRFFFEARFSANGEVSCATCHLPERDFQDGVALARGIGSTARRTMPLAGVASSTWFFWDGRKDSLWSQALGPLENEVEHGSDRVHIAHVVAERYRDEYARVFGPLPSLVALPAHASPLGSFALWDAWSSLSLEQQDAVNTVFANVGKAIAAYERKLQPGVSRFDRYVDAVQAGDDDAARSALSHDEARGLRLFIGKARCVECHNGPLFTNQDFANTGVPAVASLPDDDGRLTGARELLQDEFNCLGKYSDTPPEACHELRALHADAHTTRQFKVPSLRGVAERPPYMHAGQLSSLEAVVEHYNEAPAAPRGESEVSPLELSALERRQLVSFLRALSAPLLTDGEWLTRPTHSYPESRRPQ